MESTSPVIKATRLAEPSHHMWRDSLRLRRWIPIPGSYWATKGCSGLLVGERERERERWRVGERESGREREGEMEGGSLGVHIDLLSSLHSSDEHIAVHVGPRDCVHGGMS